MNELLSNSARFPLQKEIILTDKENELYSNKTACYLCGKEFHKIAKCLLKVIYHCRYTCSPFRI